MAKDAKDRDLVIGHDVGTGGNKAVLADVRGNLIATAFEPYPTSYPGPHRAEQDPEDWWRAVSACTRRLLEDTGTDPARVLGIGFAGQMADTVPVDAEGKPLTPVILWLDSRADEQAERIIRRLGGRHVLMRVAGALPTGKDIISKWAWLKEEEPRVFARTHKLLDSTGYLVMRATGVMQADHTGAGSTGILNNRKRDWEPLFVRLLGLPREKLPDVKRSIDVAGPLTARAAEDLGLPAGTPVVGGQADIPSAAIGSGALGDGDAHVYLGTSSWLCISVARARRLGRYGIAAVASADPEMLIMIGETETAGACLQWFADNLAGEEERAQTGEGCSIFQSLDRIGGTGRAGRGKAHLLPLDVRGTLAGARHHPARRLPQPLPRARAEAHAARRLRGRGLQPALAGGRGGRGGA